MLQLTGIRKSYQMGSNRLQVLKGIDLHVAKGEVVSIMEPPARARARC